MEHLYGYVKFGNPAASVCILRDIVQKKTETHRQTTVKTVPPPPRLQSAWVINIKQAETGHVSAKQYIITAQHAQSKHTAITATTTITTSDGFTLNTAAEI